MTEFYVCAVLFISPDGATRALSVSGATGETADMAVATNVAGFVSANPGFIVEIVQSMRLPLAMLKDIVANLEQGASAAQPTASVLHLVPAAPKARRGRPRKSGMAAGMVPARQEPLSAESRAVLDEYLATHTGPPEPAA